MLLGGVGRYAPPEKFAYCDAFLVLFEQILGKICHIFGL